MLNLASSVNPLITIQLTADLSTEHNYTVPSYAISSCPPVQLSRHFHVMFKNSLLHQKQQFNLKHKRTNSRHFRGSSSTFYSRFWCSKHYLAGFLKFWFNLKHISKHISWIFYFTNNIRPLFSPFPNLILFLLIYPSAPLVSRLSVSTFHPFPSLSFPPFFLPFFSVLSRW